MSELKTTYYIILGLISEMPDTDRAKVYDCAEKIKNIITEYGEMGTVAFAYVTAKTALEGK